MLIKKNVLIPNIVFDLISFQIIHLQLLIGVKILAFFKYKVVHQCILIIKKDILVLGKGPTQKLDGTTITTEAKYYIRFTRQQNNFP